MCSCSQRPSCLAASAPLVRCTGRQAGADYTGFLKTSDRLLAGIASTMGAAKPCAAASAVTASRSRTPQPGPACAGCDRTRRCSVRCARRRGGTGRRGRACRPRAAAAAAPRMRPDGSCPRRDVDHVDAQDSVGRGDRPRLGRSIERDGRTDVLQAGLRRVHASMLARAWRSGSLGWKSRPGNALREVHDVLARAARDLQHEPARRQMRPQHGQDRLAVAGCGRSVEACVASRCGLLAADDAALLQGLDVLAGQPKLAQDLARMLAQQRRAAADIRSASWRTAPPAASGAGGRRRDARSPCRMSLASTCGWAMTWSRVSTGAHGTPSASSRSSHSSVVRDLENVLGHLQPVVDVLVAQGRRLEARHRRAIRAVPARASAPPTPCCS